MKFKNKLILPFVENGLVLGVPLHYKKGERVYFLAGPIKGGNDWQSRAIKILWKKDPDAYIVCPCRYKTDHELFNNSLLNEKTRPLINVYKPFKDQTTWERYYMMEASYYGSIIFWLPREDKNNPRPKEKGPYARDTYGELGRWSIKSSRPDIFSYKSSEPRVNLVIGAEKKFHGLSVIQKNVHEDHGKQFQIYPTLRSTVLEAVELGKKTNP